MDKFQRVFIYLGVCLLSCFACIVIGTALIELCYGVLHPSATDDVIIGFMMLLCVVPEILVGLILGSFIGGLVVRRVKAWPRRSE